MSFYNLDQSIIRTIKRVSIPLSRFAIFVVYFWFGALKIIGTSAANPLVMQLQQHTLPFLSFHQFIVLFGLFEMLIGICFLLKGFERVAIALLLVHLITTVLPLFVLPSVTWQGFLTPTLEGQYIIKNIVIIAVAISIAANTNLRPLRS